MTTSNNKSAKRSKRDETVIEFIMKTPSKVAYNKKPTKNAGLKTFNLI